MAVERTLSIIKPDATKRNLTGAVNAVIEKAGLRIIAQKRIWLSEGQAEGFYAVHKERPFFRDLVTFMMSGPVVVQVLEGENAVAKYRDVMGATNPANAAEARSASASRNRSKPIRFTARTAPKTPRARSSSSSPTQKSSAEVKARRSSGALQAHFGFFSPPLFGVTGLASLPPARWAFWTGSGLLRHRTAGCFLWHVRLLGLGSGHVSRREMVRQSLT